MKLLRYGKSGQEKPGILDAAGQIRDLSGVISDIGPDTLTPEGLAKLRAVSLDSLPVVAGTHRYGTPVKGIGKFIAVGLNYSDHAAESNMPVPSEPVLFTKATSCIVGPNDPIYIPKDATKTDWEVELGVVIGSPCRYVEEADAGTIFLDEIGDMSRPLQAKLLRFLEDGSFTRVGGTQELRVNVRLIAATNRNIVDAIRKHEFREDLFHRLNVMQFRPPPLRDRGDDILQLAHHFLRQFCLRLGRTIHRISEPAKSALLAHSWPGNVRELRNVMERAVILETADEVRAASLPDFEVESRLRLGDLGSEGNPAFPRSGSLSEALLQFEREQILSAIKRSGGNLAKTAAQLDLSRHALRYRMSRLNLHVEGNVDEGTEQTTG